MNFNDIDPAALEALMADHQGQLPSKKARIVPAPKLNGLLDDKGMASGEEAGRKMPPVKEIMFHQSNPQDFDENPLTPAPTYWYSECWMHEIYSHGVYPFLRRAEINPPRKFLDESGVSKEEGYCGHFYWTPINESEEEVSMANSEDIIGSRLFGLTNKETREFSPVVDLKRGPDYEGFRLYAARDFQYGDAIMFYPESEEIFGRFIFGGNYARQVYGKHMSNTYLCKSNRVLRCIKLDIHKGEEIVRWLQDDSLTKDLERADQVVFDPYTMRVGKIASSLNPGGGLIQYADGEVAGASHAHLVLNQKSRLFPAQHPH